MNFQIIDISHLHEKGKRSYNEDYLFPRIADQSSEDLKKTINQQEKGLMLMVCDGVGGSIAGDQASKKVCEKFPEIARKAYAPFDEAEIAQMTLEQHQEILSDVLIQVEDAIDHFLIGMPQFRGMATTLTYLHIIGDKAVVGWIGDSRVYRFRDTDIEDEKVKETEDHSLVVQLYKSGSIGKHEMKDHPRNNRILQAVSGSYDRARIEVEVWDVKDNDVFLLCTDGILEGFETYEEFNDTALNVFNEKALEKAVRNLNKQNSPENIISEITPLGVLKEEIKTKYETSGKGRDNFTMYAIQVSHDKDATNPFILNNPTSGNGKSSRIRQLLSKALIPSLVFLLVLVIGGFLGYIYFDSRKTDKEQVKLSEKQCEQKFQEEIKKKKSSIERFEYALGIYKKVKGGNEVFNGKCPDPLKITIHKKYLYPLKDTLERQKIASENYIRDSLDKNDDNYTKDASPYTKNITKIENLIKEYDETVLGESSHDIEDSSNNTDTNDSTGTDDSNSDEGSDSNSDDDANDDTNASDNDFTGDMVKKQGGIKILKKDDLLSIESLDGDNKEPFRYKDAKIVADGVVATRKPGDSNWTLRVTNKEKQVFGIHKSGKQFAEVELYDRKCYNLVKVKTVEGEVEYYDKAGKKKEAKDCKQKTNQ